MKTAIYSVTLNDAQSIHNLMAMTKEATLIFIMDIGSTDGTFELLQDYAEKDHRVKISELDGNPSNRKLTALNSLLYMVQSSFADIAIPLDPKCVFTDADWIKTISNAFTDLSVSQVMTSINILALSENKPYVSYIERRVVAHRSTARCNWKHSVDPKLNCLGTSVDLNLSALRPVTDNAEVDVDYVQSCIQEWESDRSDIYATYKALYALVVIGSQDTWKFIPLALESIFENEDAEDNRYSAEILILIYSVTNEVKYLDLLAYYLPNHYLVAYYKAEVASEPEISIGYYLEALRNLSIGNNLTVYQLPTPKYKIHYALAIKNQDLWQKTKAPYFLIQSMRELLNARYFNPACVNLLSDIETTRKLLKENSIDEEVES